MDVPVGQARPPLDASEEAVDARAVALDEVPITQETVDGADRPQGPRLFAADKSSWANPQVAPESDARNRCPP
jgi:hypothetical protein